MRLEINGVEQTKKGYVSYKAINDIIAEHGFPSDSKVDVYDSCYGIYLFRLSVFFLDGVHVVNAYIDHMHSGRISERGTYLEYDSENRIIRKSYGRILC